MNKRTSSEKGVGFVQSFTAHPASVGESYLDHMKFAACFGSRLIGAGLAALVHALIPAYFDTTASRIIHELHQDVTARQNNGEIDTSCADL